MDNRFLPSLKALSIKNYSLYPGDLNFTYTFVEGVNLIIGGNGVGKTTFLHILKYALIGLYKRDTDVKRRELKNVEYRIEKRINLPYNFFSNRMDKAVSYNENAEVTLTFRVNDKTFEVTRNLHTPGVKRVRVIYNSTATDLVGRVISQREYDDLFSANRKTENSIKETLQWQYEDAVGKASNHEFFDNIIFLVNEVLFFNESRKTIMWDPIVQDRLSSKYFVEPKYDEQKEEAEREGKYQNSLMRHKSEDIRAITKIFEQIGEDETKNKDFKKAAIEIETTRGLVETLLQDLENVQNDREKTEVQINKLYTEKNDLNRKRDDLENRKRNEEELIFADLFKKVTPKYNDFNTFLKSSGDCPLCNNNLPKVMYEKIKQDDAHCMMCGNDIRNADISSPKLNVLKSEISEILKSIRSVEKAILFEEDNLRKSDSKFEMITVDLKSAQSSLRKLEYSIQKTPTDGASEPDAALQAMQDRIAFLTKEKNDAQRASELAYEKSEEISKIIDMQRLESREKLSGIFNQFGSKFLGMTCELVYEDPKDGDGEGKRYLPRIGGVDRLQEEELSESQRFFIDQSFRMSLINFFNSTSSFFMCETPDSSLDISYEKNAAKVFIEYLKRPNELILTSNLNNSEFLEYLIDEAKTINYINLLKIGKQSAIQSGSSELLKASNKIENMINGKNK